jgi:large subunit ribosomal protein L9
MEIILLENIINLGNIGDKVIVKPGYGRNYLLKKNKALRFSEKNLDYVSKIKDELNKKNVEAKKKYKDIAQSINNKSFVFNKESKDNGELYGTIKPKEISNKILEKSKVEIKPSQIIIKEELNKIGIYQVDINLHSEVSVKISIKIEKTQTI